MKKVRVEFVKNDLGLGPILASTPGLTLPPQISFKPYRKTTIRPTGATQELLLQSSEHARLEYTAQEEKDGSAESMLNHYIGVYDPATGKLQIVPVPKLTVRSTLRSEIEEMRAERERIEVQQQQGSMTSKRHALAAEFGSKRSKKAINELAENAIVRGARPGDATGGAPKNEAVAAAVLQGMSKTTSSMPTKTDLQATVDESKPRPPANTEAEHAADVYTPEAIVGKELLGLIPIKDWVDAAKNGEGLSLPSQYVAKRVNRLVANKEHQKLKLLRFVLLGMNFNSSLKGKPMGAKQIPNREKFQSAMGEDVPAPVLDALRRKFATESNEMTRWHIDNLMTHIAAAALIIDDFEVDVNDLRDDLKLENKEYVHPHPHFHLYNPNPNPQPTTHP
ncbi:hypothetical protein P154DRAFT_519398 [Amniculicola lignicola CBS 123094]|uniref:RNA polymerase I associated factor, A49-like protein n=1 Tax=Amniculicola lignicola CBS 123094 TaxID=1392246 RepID=A0A6A5WRQ0_9PLEO|nr:hypothetical protein P154DRAFT_519398 [Amniculicola lignicola CBS 123094]